MFNYQNIGQKIKKLAIASFAVETIGAIVAGLILLIDSGFEEAWWAILIILFGPIVAWVGSWLLYGFGEVIDTLGRIEKNTGLAYQPDELKTQYEAQERAKYEAEEQIKREIEAKMQRDAEMRAQKEAEIQMQRELKAEKQAQREEEILSQREAKERAKQGIATTVKLSRFGEVVCPACQKAMEIGDNTGLHKCPKCGCPIKVIR